MNDAPCDQYRSATHFMAVSAGMVVAKIIVIPLGFPKRCWDQCLSLPKLSLENTVIETCRLARSDLIYEDEEVDTGEARKSVEVIYITTATVKQQLLSEK